MKAKDIIHLSKSAKEKALITAKGLISQDAQKGQFQNEKKDIKYSTKGKPYSYADYKANGMRTFVRDAGRKLKGFEGRSTNKNSKSVDAKLTGETLRRITTKPGAGSNIGKLVFERGEIVLGLRGEKGADIYDLRDANKTKIAKIIEQDLARKADKWMAEDKTIRIG